MGEIGASTLELFTGNYIEMFISLIENELDPLTLLIS